MDATLAATLVEANKGSIASVIFNAGHVMEGRDFTGEIVSINSKGLNLKIDGKIRSTALRNIDRINLVSDNEVADDDITAELHDGMTTAELADLMGTTPKALRVSLRALGMGVGKGRKYSLHATAYNTVKAHVEANA
jgi:hypothetical protein